jgi:hypothetical protein
MIVCTATVRDDLALTESATITEPTSIVNTTVLTVTSFLTSTPPRNRTAGDSHSKRAQRPEQGGNLTPHGGAAFLTIEVVRGRPVLRRSRHERAMNVRREAGTPVGVPGLNAGSQRRREAYSGSSRVGAGRTLTEMPIWFSAPR